MLFGILLRLSHGRRAFTHVRSDDHKTLTRKLFVHRLHAWRSRFAWSTPSCPKVENIWLSFQRSIAKFLAFETGHRKGWHFLALEGLNSALPVGKRAVYKRDRENPSEDFHTLYYVSTGAMVPEAIIIG